MGWLRLVGFLQLEVSIAKEPYKRDLYSPKRLMISRSLLIVATPYSDLEYMLCKSIVSLFGEYRSLL